MKYISKKNCLWVVLFIQIAICAAQSANNPLVVLVQSDKANDSLSKLERDYYSLAVAKFIENITMVPEIRVHTDDTNNTLLELQKKSQIDAMKGLGSENAAYATDKGSKAQLNMMLKLQMVNNKYKIICTVSEIETKDSFSVTSDSMELTEICEDPLDFFSYKTLEKLASKKYIAEVSFLIKSQLMHEEDTAENYSKYIEEYTQMSSAYKKQLDALEQDALTAQEKSQAEIERQALLLKLEITEKRKQQMQELLRKQQEEAAVKAKQDAERQTMQNKEREQFNKKLDELETARDAILSQSQMALSLQKRIELIESSRASYANVENQLQQSIEDSNNFYEDLCNQELDGIDNKEWRKADLSDGEPTAQALRIRKNQKLEIKTKYEKLAKDAETELSESLKPVLLSYIQPVQENIVELEKTTYVFRSIDKTDDFLSLSVDAYDGSAKNWTINNDLNMDSIPKSDTSSITLPRVSIPFATMTGNQPYTGSDTTAYQEYSDLVDQADMYFRTSAPYLYSELALKVRYDTTSELYVISALYFKILKTEDGSVLFSKSSDELKQQYINQEKSVKTQYSQTYAKSTDSSDSSSQNGMTGMSFGGAVLKNSLYKGFALMGSLYFGSKYAFFGFDVSAGGATTDYTLLQYTTSSGSSSSTITTSSLLLLGDVCFTAGINASWRSFKPYALIGAGVGVCNANVKDASANTESQCLVGLAGECAAGVLLSGKTVSFDLFYRLKYLTDAGFVDAIGFSVRTNVQ